MHYVIGDVHGCYTELMQLLEKIEMRDENATIIFVGDFIDRGSSVMEVLNWMQAHITEHGAYQAVRGNHEQKVIDWYEGEWIPWLEKGGEKTGRKMPKTRYDFSAIMEREGRLNADSLKTIVDFFYSLPLQIDLKITTTHGKEQDYHIAHAWAEVSEDKGTERGSFHNLWTRNFEGNHIDDSIIIHGHTPTVASRYIMSGITAPGMIGYRKNAINVDCGCTFQRAVPPFPYMLGAICLETLEEVYPCSVRERFVQLHPDGKREEIDTIYKSYESQYLENENPYRIEVIDRLFLD